MSGFSASKLRTWLQLLRAPNLFTVPGDPLVGYLFANAGYYDFTLLLGMLASLCLYAAGLLLNDLADLAEDRRERPARPLPSGAAKPGHVWMAAGVLALLGLGALAVSGHGAALGCGVALLAAICLYNFLTKHWPVIGAVNMGLCRGLSVMVGGALGPYHYYQLALVTAVLFGLYIATVTNLARHETRARVPVTARLWPALVAILTSTGGIFYAVSAPAKLPATWIYAVVIAVALWLAIRLFRRPAPLPPLIGAHIRLLLPLQAAACWAADPDELGWGSAVGLLVLWPVARVVSRWFYAS